MLLSKNKNIFDISPKDRYPFPKESYEFKSINNFHIIYIKSCDNPSFVKYFRFYKLNKAHKVNKPAWTKHKGISYCCYNKPHALNKPSCILYPDVYSTYDSEKGYYHFGYKNRYYGPSYFHYKDGKVIKFYYKNGNLHRDEGPAVIHYRDGSITCKEYYQMGSLIRTVVMELDE